MKLVEFLKKQYNYNSEIKDNMQGHIDEWKSWYKGNVADFHNYYTYNGMVDIPQERFSLNMAKEISEGWSDILWSEKCKISMKDETNQNQFDELVNKLDMNVLINQAIEKSGALGTVGGVVSVYDLIANEDGMTLDVSNAKTRIDIVDVDWIFPLTWDNKEVIECAFGSVQYANGNKYIVLSVHKLADDGNYHIYNHLFECMKENNIIEIPQVGVMADFNTMSPTKWFAIFKPLLTNNLFNNCPFGIPHYANAISSLKSVDISFDALRKEIEDGTRITFVRADMLSYEDGTQKKVFKPTDRRYYVLPKGANKDDLIQSNSDTLRTNQQIETLNMNLNILGDKVGFGENYYHFDGTNLSTATAVISSNSKMFRRKKKLEIGYESAIFDLTKAVCYASSQFGTYNIDTEDMVITFDDSIIEDTNEMSDRALREVSAGIMSKEEYREKIYGESSEIAKLKVKEIQESQPTVEDLIGNIKEE